MDILDYMAVSKLSSAKVFFFLKEKEDHQNKVKTIGRANHLKQISRDPLYHW